MTDFKKPFFQNFPNIISRLDGSLQQMALRAAANEAIITDLCILSNLSREKIIEKWRHSPLSLEDFQAFYARFGHFPEDEPKKMDTQWTELSNLATALDKRSRFVKAKDAVKGWLLHPFYWFWYELFYLLLAAILTPIRAGWDAGRDVWMGRDD